jgi:hypothetical protein
VDGTTIVGVAGLVTTAAVGIATALIATRAEEDRFTRQARHARLDELRSVADQAAEQLLEAHDLFAQVLRVLQTARAHGEPIDPPDGQGGRSFPAEASRYAALMITMLRTRERLSLRLGTDDPIAESYVEAMQPLAGALTFVNELERGAVITDDQVSAFEALSADVMTSRQTFLDACSDAFRP